LLQLGRHPTLIGTAQWHMLHPALALLYALFRGYFF
jgi:hypothetical protein